ncbi:unnamed protein product [Rotaria magnacalcarata]
MTNKSLVPKSTIDYPWAKTIEEIANYYNVDEEIGLSEERVNEDIQIYEPNGRTKPFNESQSIIMRSNFSSTNRAAELQRHNRSDSELKQQHEVLLSILLLEQQLHSTATDEHKRRVNEVTLKIKY